MQVDDRSAHSTPRQAALRPVHARTVLDVLGLWCRNPAHKYYTTRTLTCIASAIAPLLIPPVAFSRTIHRACDTAILDYAHT